MEEYNTPNGILKLLVIGGEERPILPIHYVSDGRCSCGDGRCKAPGKHPVSHWKKQAVTPRGVKDATTDPETIATWLKLFGERPFNWGISTAGLVVIDLDPRNGGTESWQTLVEEFGKEVMKPGYKVNTPGDGAHGYWLLPPGVRIKNDTAGQNLGDGLDVKTNGGYVLIPPSVGPNGKAYTAVGSPEDAFELPASLAVRLASGTSGATKAMAPRSFASPSGPLDSFDLTQWMAEHGVEVIQEIDWEGDEERNAAIVYEVLCPFSPEDPHDGTQARVWQDPVTSVLYATCHHGRCQGKAN